MKHLNLFLLIFSLIFEQTSMAFSLTGRLLMHGNPNVYDETIVQDKTSVTNMLRRYETYRRIAFTKVALINGAEYSSKTVGTIGGVYFSGGNPIAGTIGGQIFGDALGAIGNTLREGIYKEMGDLLEIRIKQIILEPSRQQLTEMTGLPLERARTFITKNPEIFDFKNLGAKTDEERNIFHETAIEVLANKMAENNYRENLQQLQIQAHKEKIEDLKSKSIQHGNRLSKHIHEYQNFSIIITKSMEKIAESTKVILNQVQNNVKNIEKNQGQIQNIQATLFKKMSGSDKVKVLKEGWFPVLSNEERQKEIILATEQKKIENNLQIISVTAANLPGALSLFTNDPNTLSVANKASQIASGVLSVMASASLGPFGMTMAGLGAIGSIFGGSSNNGEAENQRHRQIMDKFKVVIDNQIMISQQIDDAYRSLVKGQQEIFNHVRETALELIRLGNRLDMYHIDEMKRLNIVRNYTLANMDLLRDLSGQEPKSCHNFFNTYIGKVAEVRLFDQFETFSQLEKHFNSNKDLFRPCRAGLTYVLTKQTYDHVIHSLLLTKSYSTQSNENQILWATQKVYFPARNYYETHRTKDMPASYPDLIHTESLKNYVGLAMELYPYLLMTKDTETLELQNLDSPTNLNRYSILRARALLNSSLLLINEAILQQEILAGQFWIDHLEKDLITVQDQSQKNNLMEILEDNPILRTNLSRQIVHSRIRSTNTNAFYYNNLLSGREAFPFFEAFFGSSFKPVLEDSGWKIELGLTIEDKNYSIDLPTGESVTNRVWNYSGDLLELHELRAKVINHLGWLNVMN